MWLRLAITIMFRSACIAHGCSGSLTNVTSTPCDHGQSDIKLQSRSGLDMEQRTGHWIDCFDSLGMQLSTAFTLDLVGVAMLLH